MVQNLGRYDLLSELGRGGMAHLYLGRLRGIGGFSKLVAIKRMLPHLSQDKTFVDLFLNEGRIASRLSHPNLCQVFELGEFEGELYLAMEYLEGVTWETLLRELPDDPVLALRTTASVIGQACEGMYYAHELRDGSGAPSPVIHRDISPQNLFVTVDGTCKILDFGVAKMASEATQTRSGVVKGKLPYMSPEQIRGERLDGRSDVFALGVVLWEALARRSLFMRDTEFQIWKAILDEPIERLAAATAYSDEIDAVVMRALERGVAQRFESARELGDELRRVTASVGGPLSPLELAALVRTRCAAHLEARANAISEMTTREQQRAEVATIAERPARAATTRIVAPVARSRRRLALAGAAVVLAGGATTIGLSSWGDASSEPAPVIATVAPPEPPPIDAAVAEPVPPPPLAARTPSPVPEQPARKRSQPKRREVTPKPEPVKPPAIAAEPGSLSLDVRPSARVYVDGTFVDETPLFRHRLAAGRHELRVVRPDGSSKILKITIEPGKLLNMKTLEW